MASQPRPLRYHFPFLVYNALSQPLKARQVFIRSTPFKISKSPLIQGKCLVVSYRIKPRSMLLGTGEMAWWLKVQMTLAENLHSVPSTHVRQPATTCDSSFIGFNALFWMQRSRVYIPQTQKYSHHFLKNESLKQGKVHPSNTQWRRASILFPTRRKHKLARADKREVAAQQGRPIRSS